MCLLLILFRRFKTSPIPVLQELDRSIDVDITLLTHQECPKCGECGWYRIISDTAFEHLPAVNIGLYHVVSNANTAAFFTGLNLYMQSNPLAFDQQVFQQCIERTYDVVKSKMNPMDKLHPKLARDYPVECTTKDHLSKNVFPEYEPPRSAIGQFGKGVKGLT